jgi:aquaporin Z
MPAIAALRRHWPEYLIEAAGLGVFMISAGAFTTLLEHPASPVHQAISDPLLRRGLNGLAMGLTLIAIVYSPWGQRSGAHLNPALTLTFYRLGKVQPWDAVFYVAAQFLGGLLGVLLVVAVLGQAFAMPPVSFIATLPGSAGELVAFVAEVAMTFALMLMVLSTANARRLMRFTGLIAAGLVAFYITLEAPLSGMSMNPARTAASALPSGLWAGIWIYFSAPLLGMLLAAEAHRLHGRLPVLCAKLNHHGNQRCIFNCGHMAHADAPAAGAPMRAAA